MLNRLIVCFTIALALAPIASDYFGPSWKARWILADAANQYDREKVDLAREQLRKAIAMAPDIVMDPNFWQLLAKIELSDKKIDGNIAEWIETLNNIEPESVRRIVAYNAANSLFQERRFDIAVELLDKFMPPASQRTSTENNQIAYFRSVEGHDLDIALEEIELSLKKSVNEGNLDTKAWILHEQQSDAEALGFSNQAIQMAMKTLERDAPKMFSLVETRFVQLLAQRTAAMDSPAKPTSENAVEKDAAENDAAGKELAKKEGAEKEVAEIKEAAEITDAAEISSDAVPTIATPPLSMKLFKSGELRIEFERQFTTPRSHEALKQIAVLRYHRQCILNALKRNAEAAKDELWLKAFGFEDPKELF